MGTVKRKNWCRNDRWWAVALGRATEQPEFVSILLEPEQEQVPILFGARAKRHCFKVVALSAIFFGLFLFSAIFRNEVTTILTLDFGRRAATLNQFSLNSHGWCGSIHGWTLLFLQTIGPVKPQLWRKMCPQNQFFGFKSDGMWFFEKTT